MARNVQLGEMLDAFRAEISVSLDRTSSQNSLDIHKYAIRNAQKFLYETWDWPMLNIYRDVVLNAGQRLYDFPDQIEYEGVRKVWTKWGAEWVPVEFGIRPEDYNAFDEGSRSDPVMRWDVREGTQIEVWPTPSSAGSLRMSGKMSLLPLVNENDRSTLDDHLIVLFAAWKWLSRNPDDAGAASAKREEFQTYSNKLKGNASAAKSNAFSTAGDPRPVLRPGIDYIASR
jgi:hypothetical protein